MVPSARTLFAGLLAALLIAPCASRPAWAHTPPDIYVSVSVDDESLDWELTVSASIFADWFSLDTKQLPDLASDAEKLAEVQDAVAAFFTEWGGVTIDRVPVKGIVRSVRYEAFLDHEIEWDYVQVRVSYATKGKPKQVGLVWRNYNGGLGGYYSSVEAEIAGYGETEYYVFRESEPEVVWHAPRETRVRTPVELPRVRGPRPLTVPWVTVGFIALGALLLLWLRRRDASRFARGATLVLALGMGLGLSEVALGDLTLPWAQAVERPGEAEASEIFESLLRNIYRAFDFEAEDEIYDTLALSVSGDLLDDLYLEIHGSLILQEAGGAVSKVQKVEVDPPTLLPAGPDQGQWFDLEATWRVQGKVGHWGHTHVRLNGYKARFTVAEADGGWKIADMQILTQERLDDGAAGEGR